MREKCVLLTFFFFLFYFTTYPDVPIYLSWPTDGAKISPANIQFSWYTTTGTYGLQFVLQITETKNPTELQWSSSPLNQSPTTDLYKIITLAGGKTYYWRVAVQKSDGTVLNYSAVNTLFTNGGGKLLVYPTWPNGNIEYTLTPTFYWYADQYPAGIKYQIKVYLDENEDGKEDLVVLHIPGDDNKILTSGISNLFYTAPNGVFQPGKSYLWQVRGYDPTGLSRYSYKAFGTYSYKNRFKIFNSSSTVPGVPIPTYPCGVDIYTSAPILYWYYPGIAVGLTFELEIKGFNGYNNTISCFSGFSSQLSCLLPGSYSWRVKVCNGSWSDWYHFTIIGGCVANAIAEHPMNIVEYTTRPTLFWHLQGSCTDVTGYIVKYSTTNYSLQPGGWNAFNPSSNNATGGQKTIGTSAVTKWQIDTDLAYGVTYYWAITTKQNSNYSTGSFTIYNNEVCNPVPILVYPLNGSIVYPTTVSLVWFVNGPFSGITQYEIKYADSQNLNDLDAVPSVYSSPSGSIVKEITNLTPGHTYYWKVRSLPQSNWSQTWSFTVNPGSCFIVQPCIGDPDNIDLKTKAVKLTWRVPIPAGNQKYDVVVADNPDFKNSETYKDIEKQNLQLTDLNDITYYWKVRAVGTECIPTPYSAAGKFVVKTSTNVSEEKIPSDFFLKQNYPNPFNPVTTIEYSIPIKAHVKISVFNMLGQEIKTLLDADKDAGVYRVNWYGDDNSGYTMTSGVYFYKVTSGDNTGSRKMILLK